MAVETVRHVRKALYVDAVRVTSSNFDDVVAWCQGEEMEDDAPGKGVAKRYIKVRVHNPKNARQTKAFVGDWILYTERGYKVYTNKAFHASFNPVGEAETEDLSESNFPLFYIDESNGWLTDQPPHEGAEALSFDELMVVLKSEMNSKRRFEDRRRKTQLRRDQVNQTQPTFAAISQSREEVEVSPGVTMSAGMQSTYQATPVNSAENVEDLPAQESIVPAAAEGKRVLSVAEQKELTADEVRELVQSGEAVLVQDLPEG